MMRRALRHLTVLLFLILAAAGNLAAAAWYWEEPAALSSEESRYPQTAYLPDGSLSAVVWQDVVPKNKRQGTVWLSGQFAGSDSRWQTSRHFAGPIEYTGDVPSVFSMAVRADGTLAVAALTDPHTVTVYTSTDGGASFTSSSITQTSSSSVAPRIFARKDGSFIIFATCTRDETFVLTTSSSKDGIAWTPFEDFGPSENLQNPFVPTLVATGTGDLVVFQSSYTYGQRNTYQLYATSAATGSDRWSPARIITNQDTATQPFANYTNQRASLLYADGTVWCAFERTFYSSESSRIFVCQLSEDGQILQTPYELSTGTGIQYQPQFVNLNGQVSLVWVDFRTGIASVWLGQLLGNSYWEEEALASGNYAATFGSPLITGDRQFHLVWQQSDAKSNNRVTRLSPDLTCAMPVIKPQSFKAGNPTAASSVAVSLVMPQDSSGVAGFSYSWSQDPSAVPPEYLMQLSSDTRLNLTADTDGIWYFKARAIDYAGNASAVQGTQFVRDTTPPQAPALILPPSGRDGYLTSNTFTMSWQAADPESDSDIAGYTYALEYVASRNSRISQPPRRILTRGSSFRYNNRENGLYAFSVAAIDQAGNIGPAAVTYLQLNKFIPYTAVSAINATQDQFGTVTMNIIGRGFDSEGQITAIYLTKDGLEDALILTADSLQYSVTSDRRIGSIELANLDGGTYKVGLLHSKRGLYWATQTVKIVESGTVKLGDYTYRYVPSFERIISSAKYTADFSYLIFLALFVFVAGCLLASVRGIVQVARESQLIKAEVQSLMTGDVMPQLKKEQAKSVMKRGASLKYRMAFFTSSLVLGVVLMVSVTLGFMMVQTQRETLSQSLKERVDLALESLNSGAKAYMPSQNVLEMSFLPGQVTGSADIVSATITGLPMNGSTIGLEYVWATNDDNILEHIDGETLTFGTSRLTGEEYTAITENALKLNQKAADAVSQMAEDVTVLTAEGVSLALKTDKASQERMTEVQQITRQLSEKITQELNAIAQEGSGSYPEYTNDAIYKGDNTRWLFYKPVLYRQGSDQTFVRGLIILEVSTEPMLRELSSSRQNIIYAAVIVAALTVLIGIIGSLMVANIIIRPIKLLAAHVAMIRDTEDKEELEGKDIKITSKDEIGMLGATVNDMTHALVKAAAASKDLTMGKEIQKMFIPLETDAQGRKLTTGSIEDERTQIFGYYEGAKGVSGDYFDSMKLDDVHYALIKCDVSGKGVPAALIMVQVATLYLNYFKDWSYKKNGYNLSPVVSQINDLIESRGFKGRFAAFSLCIYNSKNGDAYFCNAGDNLVHIYEAATGKKKVITLPESAAAGVFPSFMVDMKGGFPVVKVHLEPGDVMFLYTDGIEEAKRLFRDKDYKPVLCQEPGLKEGDEHGSHTFGQDGEEMTPERVTDIIESVYHQRKYTLKKWHNPIPDELLEFDFSTCGDTARDGVMALVSVEKIFRMYKKPGLQETDRVQVDSLVDEFLNEHFLQYNDYCAYRKDHPQFAEYKYYTHMTEDDQYDDLTLLALKRKK
ncbi:MAG: SpoIIE family protein phosphatase [Treponemataceae bacterium]|nr:SpoIIE family protein phosphatase [Treponemataceae bacterium]